MRELLPEGPPVRSNGDQLRRRSGSRPQVSDDRQPARVHGSREGRRLRTWSRACTPGVVALTRIGGGRATLGHAQQGNAALARARTWLAVGLRWARPSLLRLRLDLARGPRRTPA